MGQVVATTAKPRRALPGAIATGHFDQSVFFEGLANPTRLAAVRLLAEVDEMGVTELARLCNASQPRMSWHLRILRQAHVITSRRDGREILCRLNREAIGRHLGEFLQTVQLPQDTHQQLKRSLESLQVIRRK